MGIRRILTTTENTMTKLKKGDLIELLCDEVYYILLEEKERVGDDSVEWKIVRMDGYGVDGYGVEVTTQSYEFMTRPDAARKL